MTVTIDSSATVRYMTCGDARVLLEMLVEKLDELDMDEYFGPDGWRSMLLGEE